MKTVLTLLAVALALTGAPAYGAELATITGKIKVTGDELPGPELKLISKDPEVCGTGQRAIHWFKEADGGLVDETIVFIEGDFDSANWDDSEVSAELVQESCLFKPYVGIWKNGADVKIVSKDQAAHNIHTYERIGAVRRELFNFNQPNEDVRTVAIKPRRGQYIELTCDNHDFMAGWRFVAKNPYCTVANEGTFTLKVPAGEHTLKVWHPIMGELEEDIDIAAGENLTVDFEFEYEE